MPLQVVGCALVDVMAAVQLQDSKAAGKRLIKAGPGILAATHACNYCRPLLLPEPPHAPCMPPVAVNMVRWGACACRAAVCG